MPKAPAKSKTKAARNSKDPLPKPKEPKAPKDPKASHLYTDDNPATTIHGTGFKDKSTALKTLDLIKRRSLTYQFQTVNTMFYRAKHHPAMKKTGADTSESTADMRAAMEIFRTWLDETYPAAREALRAGGFKPVLSKKVMQRDLPQIEESKALSEDAKGFALTYASLPKGKRLGNVLVDDSKPKEQDWEIRRYQALDELVPPGKEENAQKWGMSEIWTEDRKVAEKHLELIAWGWSPVTEGKLP